MNPECPDCKTLMIKSHNEYYCPKCGLVIEDIELIANYDADRTFSQPWMANFSQTIISDK